MHRIDGPGATVDGRFTEGDPIGGVAATVVTDDWLNTVQEEIAAVIESRGSTLDKANSAQLLAAINAKIAAAIPASPSDATTSVKGLVELATDLETTAGTDTTRAVTPAGVKAAIGAQPLESARIDVASASVVDLSALAPSTRHINITGNVNITSFGILAGRCYFVRFAGSQLLINSASLITQTGVNIQTSPGDTMIIRATAANVVEVLCYAPGGGWDKAFNASGFQKLPSGMILQWGSSFASIAPNGGVLNITFPVSYVSNIGFSTAQVVVASPSNGVLSLHVVATSLTNLNIVNWDTDSTVTQIRWFALGW